MKLEQQVINARWILKEKSDIHYGNIWVYKNLALYFHSYPSDHDSCDQQGKDGCDVFSGQPQK